MKLPAKEWLDKAAGWIRRFKYPALVLLVGLVLALLPSRTDRTAEAKTTEPVPTEAPVAFGEDDYCAATERELAAILSRISGAGRVEVMLTLRCGESVQYQTDFENSNQSGETVHGTAKQTTVILRREGAYDEAAVVRTEYPVFQGALIVSEGANDPVVRLALENAVSALLHLGTDKITVVKMK